ncbi:hypothetical protein PHLGIDRAFT_25886 [Phlebiopsis gigantea 11061_1 CR5-6]|uniref:Utp14-domain-containing protein n=1 Tax=Phlebiopsis gigantea (strain 11061_1 CR5-6) TaxID=745531 RepID=A0A0C3S2N5_PHLG1|nr:hypothetical protein PHLGIDRAFT_25886 [Phlebiopsis gigantea 11061_1 CR5-6]
MPPKTRSTRPLQPSHKKSNNAAGYAKRKSLKSKAVSNPSDVYEYQPERVRRAKVKLQLEKDELLGVRGRGGDGDSDAEGSASSHGQLRPRLVGENDDDEGIASDEDEELDSDAAFDDSDEERFAGFDFPHSKLKKSKNKLNATKPTPSKGVRFAEVDLNEDSDMVDADAESEHADSEDDDSEEEEEEGDPDEFIDVLDILDGRGQPESEDDSAQVAREGSPEGSRNGSDEYGGNDLGEVDEEIDAVGEGENDSDDEEEDDSLSHGEHPYKFAPDDEEDADPSALDHLENFITSLDTGSKRKASEDADAAESAADKRKRRRRILKEQTQAGVESEFAAQAGASKLSIDDLLAPLDASSSALQSLKKSAKVLTSSSSKAKTLSAPLPQRTKERLDREAAYEQTKEEIDNFPLQAEGTARSSNLELTAKFKPVTEMESAVDRLLKSAKMREQDIAQTEALKMNHLSVEEVAERRAELAKMRELMFRAEAKAKRVAKIKSKTYRRLKKKEKAKLAAKLGELDDEEASDEESRLKREVERARERATLRHKSTGKWAKAMKARGELDQDQRKEINEMLDRGEKLRRRIQGRGSDESDEDDEDSGHEGEDGIGRVKASAFDELRQLREGGESQEIMGKKGKGVFEMKFMKDAMARDQQRAEQVADDFIKEMGGGVPDEDAEDGDILRPVNTTSRVGGRMSFHPGNVTELSRSMPSLGSDTSSVTLRSTDVLVNSQPTSPVVASPIVSRSAPLPEAQCNPWLAPRDDGPNRAAQKKHEVVVGKESAGADKSKNKLRKRVKKREEEKEKAKEEASVEISMASVMTLGAASANAEAGPSKVQPKLKTVQRTESTPAQAPEDDGEEVHSEAEDQERALRLKSTGRGKGVKAFEQRELVARAFAGDNVIQEFAEAKRREMQEDAPKEVDTTLAGWGSWGGVGTRKAPPKPYLIKKVAGVNPTSRADYNKTHVIISEKRDKKAAKYLVKDLPFPYTSKAQFERSMDTPIGTEWNTRVGFQRGTLPKVVKKMGTIITPLEKLT